MKIPMRILCGQEWYLTSFTDGLIRKQKKNRLSCGLEKQLKEDRHWAEIIQKNECYAVKKKKKNHRAPRNLAHYGKILFHCSSRLFSKHDSRKLSIRAKFRFRFTVQYAGLNSKIIFNTDMRIAIFSNYFFNFKMSSIQL